MSTPESNEFSWHESAGARILLPSRFSLVQPFPELYAKTNKGLSAMIVMITSSRSHLDAVERIFHMPPKSMPPMEVQIVYDSPISGPRNGQELAVELNMTVTSSMSCTLRRIEHLDAAAGVYVDMNFIGEGAFSEWEQTWHTISDSFSWDSTTGGYLRMDGDEREFRILHKQKPKRVRKASLPKLPTQLGYLQKSMNELMSLPPDEVNEDWDSTPLVKALEKRVKGLLQVEAENRVKQDIERLHEWIREDADPRSAGEFVAAFMDGFHFYLGSD